MKSSIIELKHTIAQSLTLSHLTSEQQDKIIESLMSAVAIKVELMIWGLLSEDDKKELKTLKLEGDQFMDYMSGKIDNLPQIIENITRETVEEFRSKRRELAA